MARMRRLFLASTSPRRLKLLTDAGFAFESVEPDYAEDMTRALPPAELVQFLSKAKAESIIGKVPKGVIVAADTFVVHEGKPVGKPHTAERAKEMLRLLRGSEHSIITGYAVIDRENGKEVAGSVEAHVRMRDMTDAEIDDYVATGEPLDKAGAYAIQGEGAKFIERIDGDFVTIVGLPVARITEILKEFGIFPNV